MKLEVYLGAPTSSRPWGLDYPDLVVVDNFSAVKGGIDGNAEWELEPLLRNLQSSAQSVIVVHHEARKGANPKGSNILNARARAMWQVTQTEHSLAKFQTKKSNIGANVARSFTFQPVNHSVILEAQTDNKEHILALVAAQQSLTQKEIIEATELPKSTVSDILTRLKSKEQVAVEKSGKYKYYSVIE